MSLIIKALMAYFDVNKDGYINFDEFLFVIRVPKFITSTYSKGKNE